MALHKEILENSLKDSWITFWNLKYQQLLVITLMNMIYTSNESYSSNQLANEITFETCFWKIEEIFLESYDRIKAKCATFKHISKELFLSPNWGF